MVTMRAKHRPSAASLVLLVVILSAVGAMVWFGVGQLERASSSRAIQRGPVVAGTTTGVESTFRGGGAWIRVRFTTRSGEVADVRLREFHAQQIVLGRVFPVAYLPGHPHKAEISGEPVNTVGHALFDLGVAGAVGMIVVVSILNFYDVQPISELVLKCERRLFNGSFQGPAA